MYPVYACFSIVNQKRALLNLEPLNGSFIVYGPVRSHESDLSIEKTLEFIQINIYSIKLGTSSKADRSIKRHNDFLIT